MDSMEAKERAIPLALLAIGLVILFIYVHMGGDGTAAQSAAGIGVFGAINVVVGIVALFITAAVMDVSFGPLGSAVIKLAAIFVFPGAVALLIPWLALAWLVSFFMYLGLLAWLFDLEGWEVIVCAVIIWVVRLFAGFAAAAVLP